MFLDEAKIEVSGGDGGDGCVSWRREKYVPKGGPDGGNGGRGGNVVFVADSNTDTLSDFASRKRFEAEKGGFGRGAHKAGKAAEDLILAVPPGTTVSEVDPTDPTKRILIGDLRVVGDQLVAAAGGRGGFGNGHFLSSTRQRPDFAELGEPGEHRFMILELKLVADVGIIGYPSVGKSTLISVISAARPKIAAYPFTTLVPNLGVVTIGSSSSSQGGRSFVVCDIPGLIEGASEGKGLGDKFLKHVERCGVLLHLLDIERALEEGNKVNVQKLIDDYHAIRKELHAYSETLDTKRELVLLNKTDLIGGDTAAIEKELKKNGIDIYMSISSATKGNTDELVTKLLPLVLEEREKRAQLADDIAEEKASALPILKPQEASIKMGAYRIEKKEDGHIYVTGKRLEQFTAMTNFDSAGAVERFRDVLDRIGFLRALKQHLKKENEEDADRHVYIGKVRVDEHL
ncbi:GTPase ObgE [Candidatus Peribacteria bacterium]|nr:MAG: GTPase ObgE [Candidatus Peribacteria bacterium]